MSNSSRNFRSSDKIKVYAKKSTVPDSGIGLFAITNIKKDSIIVEFKGKLKKPLKFVPRKSM